MISSSMREIVLPPATIGGRSAEAIDLSSWDA